MPRRPDRTHDFRLERGERARRRLAELERELTEIARRRADTEVAPPRSRLTGRLVLPVCPYVL
jgi:hypothetical protein